MTPTETERDLDDYSEEFDANSHDDFESNHVYDENQEFDSKLNLENHFDSKLDMHQNDSLNANVLTDNERHEEFVTITADIENVFDGENTKTQEDILSEILEDTEASSSDIKPKSLEDSKSDGISDPLRDFTEVDLS